MNLGMGEGKGIEPKNRVDLGLPLLKVIGKGKVVYV